MRPLPQPTVPICDRVVYGDYTPRLVVEEVAQLLGFDPREVMSISITADEVAVITLDVEGSARLRVLHRSVIR